MKVSVSEAATTTDNISATSPQPVEIGTWASKFSLVFTLWLQIISRKILLTLIQIQR